MSHALPSLLLGASTSLLKREDTQDKVTLFFCEQNKGHEEVGWKTHLYPSSTGT